MTSFPKLLDCFFKNCIIWKAEDARVKIHWGFFIFFLNNTTNLVYM